MANEKKNMPTLDDQYQRLIDARNYHYDNLNKWLMTFYVIIGALFVAFYSLKESEYRIIVSVIGYGVSLSAWLSAKGYFYWENKWIEKICDYEKNILKFEKDMLVYSYLVNPIKHDNPYNPIKGANVSTTKVTIFMTAFISIAWGFLIMMLCLNISSTTTKILISIVSSLVVSYISMIIGSKALPSIENKEVPSTTTKGRKKK